MQHLADGNKLDEVANVSHVVFQRGPADQVCLGLRGALDGVVRIKVFECEDVLEGGEPLDIRRELVSGVKRVGRVRRARLVDAGRLLASQDNGEFLPSLVDLVVVHLQRTVQIRLPSAGGGSGTARSERSQSIRVIAREGSAERPDISSCSSSRSSARTRSGWFEAQ